MLSVHFGLSDIHVVISPWVFVCLFVLVFFLAMLGPHCCTGFSLVVVRGGFSLVMMCRFLIVVASLVVGYRL